MKYKIGVSGSSVNNCEPGAFKKAQIIGQQIAETGAICVTGDTSGVPHHAAHGAKKAGGLTVGISPASSRAEHVKKYHLPADELDIIIYTGFAYSGRNLLFVRACDGVIFICGRIGTLNEFTIAFEDKKPIGILTGSGGTMAEVEHLLKIAERGRGKVVTDNDPKTLVKKVINLIKKEERKRQKGRERGKKK